MTADAGLMFFCTFWLFTMLAFIFRAHFAVRKIYVFLFVSTLMVFGFFGHSRWLWPFYDWHLWGGVRSFQGEFYELYAEDSQGRLFLYDGRAIPPKLPTQTQLVAGQLLCATDPDQQARLTGFLLTKANQWCVDLQTPAHPLAFLAFPPREYGRRWSAEQMSQNEPFVRLRARRVRFDLSSDGQRVEQTVIEERAFP